MFPRTEEAVEELVLLMLDTELTEYWLTEGGPVSSCKHAIQPYTLLDK